MPLSLEPHDDVGRHIFDARLNLELAASQTERPRRNETACRLTRVAFATAAGLLMGCAETAAPAPPQPDWIQVFEGYLGVTAELLRYDSASGAAVRMLAPGLVVMDPAPSPDGTRIAFVVADYQSSTGDIFVINRDGSGRRQLTFDSELDDQPAWSPDGARIAFRSFRAQLDGDIWVMDSSGANPVNLTPDPLPGLYDVSRPAWSPDGARIAFASNEGGNIDIWTMAADGSDRQRVTNTMDLDAEPAWAPSGHTIAFRRSSSTAGSDIYLVAVPGGAVLPIALPGEQRMPAWSPDGARLVFVSQASVTGRADLVSANANGGDRRPLVGSNVPGGSINPAFLRRP